MSVNLEVKGTLAKLLATEDLIVEHRRVRTAKFNVRTRVLTLPTWDNANNAVFDLLVAHEVGHALFTPDVDIKSTCPKSFINVTEDARVEAKMKQKYGGLPKTFYRGYKELCEKDFFKLEDLNVNDMRLADRVNLYFKIGNFLNIDFSDKEQDLLNKISSANTFNDAIEAAEYMYFLDQQNSSEDATKQEIEEDDQEIEEGDQEIEEGDQVTAQDTEQDTEQDTGNVEIYGNEDGEENDVEPTSGNQGSHSNNVTTMDNLEDTFQEMTNLYGSDPIYIEYPDIDIDKIIVSNSDIHSCITEYTEKYIKMYNSEDDNASNITRTFRTRIEKYKNNFKKFKKDIQSEVNYMVKEFECKKSAQEYARASTSSTGLLDCSKLHTYKYNQDLFKKVTTYPNGKSHGLIFILDWSGSMNSVLKDTVKQLISLLMFCKKVNIPFEVYAFTNEWKEHVRYVNNHTLDKVGEFYIGQDFSLLNIISSSSKIKFINQLETLYSIADAYSDSEYSLFPHKLALSGTPLTEALICLNKIIPNFKLVNNIEKVHTMVLTDGEAQPISYTEDSPYQKEGISLRRVHPHASFYVRNKKTGTISAIGYGQDVNDVILNDLRLSYPQSTITGFRLLESGSQQWYVRNAIKDDPKKQAQWKKEKAVCITNRGYNKYFIIGSSKLQEEVEFNVESDVGKASVQKAFLKSLKSKKNNKKILGEFIGMIA